ncbi:ABC transporter ATP-binding protein [Streptomyces sp. MI02-2A]|uniref:ABC transporter ATP-binding protein n=1 Tax=Streptomyces sp. MI02-2A TaxID=3028688 RepID=UPI0029ABD8C2|nr:ABC transporter ATP-binding protein [Streptomyces sp. MI02-2A]MDX3264987.1 ABC transporter ATP-binding protein [Streptomyces sp. MI02-2A]
MSTDTGTATPGRIRLERLVKQYPGGVGIRDLDLVVHDAEFLVLLGPSGCGKTTTMRCIAGLEQPDSGTVSIAGRVVFDSGSRVNVPVNRRNVGMVFQSYAVWPHKTVEENVGFPLLMQKMPKPQRRQRVDEVLELVGLAGHGSRQASNLSGGQMQRVALARSIAMRPEVLLMDEPLSNLDAKLRERLRVDLKALQQRLESTVVYVTHDQAEALAVADRIVVLNGGCIEQIATPDELYRSPATRFVAAFIGNTNVFDVGRVDATAVRLGRHVLRVREAPDDVASISIRAEDIVVAPPDGCPNTLPAVAEVVSLLGSQVLLTVVLPDGQRIEVLSPTGSHSVRNGDSVTVGLPVDALRCYGPEVLA